MQTRKPSRRRRHGAPPTSSLDQADRALLKTLDASFARAATAAGPWLACRPGCAECCYGPFPITALDGRRLREALGRLEDADPARAERIRRRAARARSILLEDFPGDARTGCLDDDEERLDAYFARHGRLACPALDPDTETCELYDARPVVCRTFGPPLRYGDEPARHCRLCFVGAPPEELERCRLDPDPQDREGRALALLAREQPGEPEAETLIALALTVLQ